MVRNRSKRTLPLVALVVALLFGAGTATAQTCTMDREIDVPTYTAVTNTARQYLQMAASGNVAGLRQAALPVLANSFGGVESAVAQDKDGLNGPLTVKHVYILDASKMTQAGDAQFYCGVFGATGATATSATINIPGMQPGRYAMVVQTVQSAKGPYMLTQILQQQAGQWKLAGFYLKPTTVKGKDWQQFWKEAVAFKNQGKNLAAYLYFYQVWNFLAPVDFMSTLNLDRVSTALQSVPAPEIPSGNTPASYNTGKKTYQITQIFPLIDQGKLTLIVKHQVPDVSNTSQTFMDNTALMSALVNQHPELRTAFDQMVARAVPPAGEDYGTVLAMKDIR